MNEQGMTGARADAIELLTAQHREVEQLWRRLQQAHAAGDDLQRRLGEEIVTMLSRHDAIETQFLYPTVRDVLGDRGTQLSDRSLDEHQKVRELLTRVDGESAADADVFQTFSQCLHAVLHHVREEETEIFPALRSSCDEQQLMELGDELAGAMKIAPTHPHPHMPNSQAGAAVAGVVSGIVDKARDAVKGRSDR